MKDFKSGEIETLASRDSRLEEWWHDFSDVPMNPETKQMEVEFLHFPAGTDREEIWKWFDERHSKGIYYLLYGEQNTDSPLLSFIKQEVDYRLKDIIRVDAENITEELKNACVRKLYDDSDLMFDYDSIDNALEEICGEFQVKCGDE